MFLFFSTCFCPKSFKISTYTINIDILGHESGLRTCVSVVKDTPFNSDILPFHSWLLHLQASWNSDGRWWRCLRIRGDYIKKKEHVKVLESQIFVAGNMSKCRNMLEYASFCMFLLEQMMADVIQDQWIVLSISTLRIILGEWNLIPFTEIFWNGHPKQMSWRFDLLAKQQSTSLNATSKLPDNSQVHSSSDEEWERLGCKGKTFSVFQVCAFWSS